MYFIFFIILTPSPTRRHFSRTVSRFGCTVKIMVCVSYISYYTISVLILLFYNTIILLSRNLRFFYFIDHYFDRRCDTFLIVNSHTIYYYVHAPILMIEFEIATAIAEKNTRISLLSVYAR